MRTTRMVQPIRKALSDDTRGRSYRYRDSESHRARDEPGGICRAQIGYGTFQIAQTIILKPDACSLIPKCGALPLSSVIHGSVEVRKDVGGTPEVRGGDLPEVDCMVPGLHLADHAALQVGESLVEERGPGLTRGVWRAGEGAVLRLKGLGKLAGQVLLLRVEEVQGEDAALFDEVMRVWVLTDGDDDLLRLEGDLRDPAGGEPVGLAIRAHDAGDVEAVGDRLEDLTSCLLFHAFLPLWRNRRSAPTVSRSGGILHLSTSAFQLVSFLFSLVV